MPHADPSSSTLPRTAPTLHQVRAGRRGAPLLVLIHAVALDLTYWDRQFGALAESFDVIAYDLAGHGASPAPGLPFGFDDAAEDLARVIETAGAGPACVVGLSVGGMIAQTLALARPDLVRALCLMDTVSTFAEAGREAVRGRAAQVRAGGMEAIVAPTLERWFTPSFAARRPDVLDRVAKTLRAADPDVHAAMWDMISTLDVAPRLTEIDRPTLVMVGEKDLTTPVAASEVIARGIPGARLEIIPDASHMAPLEAPEEVNRHLLGFLNGL
ncbi:alpha/beta fold hydrolase [Xanthobacter sp. YC-JY1]|uniref:alpha/beta fold hydrolase n=1 Tax=Xanthobacter sp. YC-JY1 TaxID=2419844 RepID=UPI001F2CF524|nr:alpha/beta fold hydrolase [Xanthobacter sp. YC-JY1]UJX46696.1 alpha/beta fold hydrolase [Xanthobacter sp. YC-JY1]